MTEKQGGSDVRANTTRAVSADQSEWGQGWHLTGHKWFCSAPMSDAFLTLAKNEQWFIMLLCPKISTRWYKK